ncbi:DUF1289 domain-containing protein [Litchfieldella xinjiangensis]|uniref:DUF1289 domain-containing protein n=1 Tax=Litchfieldella xinjiangensis TaxID=1166948 RepID=UPI0005BD6F9B|nr:DUF1289 domain-containing protein [Halomonas xinjiangensis]
MNQRIVSPCVGLCSTTVGDCVCRGCQRHDDEIRDWFGLPADERAQRMNDIDAMRESVASRFLRVIDPQRLEAQMRRHGIRFRTDQPALSRVVELLRVGRHRIGDLSQYGVEPIDDETWLAPGELHERLAHALLEAGHARRDRDRRSQTSTE